MNGLSTTQAVRLECVRIASETTHGDILKEADRMANYVMHGLDTAKVAPPKINTLPAIDPFFARVG